MDAQKFVDLISNLSGDDDNLLHQLQAELKKSEELLLKNQNHLDNIINTLDPAAHSLGLLHLLYAKTKGNFDPDKQDIFINQTSRFLIQCTPRQIRIDPRRFRNVCQTLTDACQRAKQPIRAIRPLRHAIWKIAADHLTPQHAMFALSCILAKCYKASQSVLDKFVYEIDPDKTAIESIDTRLYFFYGGVAYIGLRQYEKALEFFEIVISAPALESSAIMVEAYKKYVLVSLIHRGATSSLPKYTNNTLLRQFKNLCSAYEEFATAFETRSIVELNKISTANGDTFLKDGNLGLINQAIQALFRQNIQRLTKTYLTLSIKDISEQVGLDNVAQTEQRVFGMIEKSQVFAKINQKDGMVEFLENPELYNDNNTLQYMDRQLHNTINLTTKVKDIDEQITLSQKYISKVLQMERGPVQGQRSPWDDDDVSPSLDKHTGGFRG